MKYTKEYKRNEILAGSLASGNGKGTQMNKEETKKSKIIYRVVRVLVILLIFSGVGLYIYADDYYRPSLTAEEALVSSTSMTFEEVGGDLILTPENPKGGVVIYPGGKVSERAYGYLAGKIAAMGYKTVIIKAPLKLSILSNQAAKGYVEEEGIKDWVIMGHSLGGVSASRFVKKNPEKIKALILLAAYPDGNTDLRGSSFKVYSLVGDKDGVIDYGKLKDGEARLPSGFEGVIIPGGNHSSFANYGVQEGDQLPDIGYEDQQQYILDILLEVFGE